MTQAPTRARGHIGNTLRVKDTSSKPVRDDVYAQINSSESEIPVRCFLGIRLIERLEICE